MLRGMRLPSLLLLVTLSGCATGYHASGYMGGFSETQLGPNVFRVSFEGNNYTSGERAENFMMLRSAELALAHGFRYFSVATSKDSSSSDSTVYFTKHNAHVSNDYYPGRAQTIVCFAEKPSEGGLVYDATFLRDSIAKDYGIELEKKPLAAR